MMFSIFPIPNIYLLYTIIVLIISCLLWIHNEINREKVLLSQSTIKQSNSNISLLSMESILSCNENNNIDDDNNIDNGLNIYDSNNDIDIDYNGKKHNDTSNSNEINSVLKSISSDNSEIILNKNDIIVSRHSQFNDIITKLNEVNQQTNSVIKNDDNNNISNDSTDTTVLNSNANSNLSNPITSLLYEESVLVLKIMNPLLKGCELDHPNVLLLTNKYKNLSKTDVIRFLIARKGKLELTIEMIDKYLEWHKNIFPIDINEVKNVIESNCFLIHKRAIDQTPVLYMRGGYYNNKIATPLQYVLLASHLIEFTLKNNPDQINVTVIVNTSNIPNAPNLPPDLAFIRLFVKILSDNFPERLKRLIIYPFPWYGRAIWNIAKLFVDIRTQEKTILIAGNESDKLLPKDIFKYVNIDQIPECLYGTDKDPIIHINETFS